MFAPSLRPMKLNTKSVSLLVCLASGTSIAVAENAEHRIIRQQIVDAGFVDASKLYDNPDERLAGPGKVFFESDKGLSLNGNISCKTCHQDKFGSADGIPNAAAIGGGDAVGPERLLSGAKQLPRNTLPFWGRGGRDFNVFFWDGKIDFSGEKKISQFGSNPPSNDPLISAVHLPVVEIREMLDEDAFVSEHKLESVKKAVDVYKAISERLQRIEPKASADLAELLGKKPIELEFIDYARAIASFIRSKFRIKETKLERFVEGTENLSDAELRGARIFYGKGSCVSCHNGPYFSDFKFHTVPYPQLGFGKNGFGVDYGRYNVTFNVNDLYKLRTPPLYNVEKTGPYSHSGAVENLERAITAHFDPLSLVVVEKMDAMERYEFAKRLAYSESNERVSFLDKDEVRQVVDFLKTLTFSP
jgi:cytochrome c peroxidase